MKMLESQIKKQCSRQLESWGWEVIHLIQTNKNGIPDTLILRRGQAVFIEFKRPSAVPRELQQYRIGKIKAQGFDTLIVKSLADIQHLHE